MFSTTMKMLLGIWQTLQRVERKERCSSFLICKMLMSRFGFVLYPGILSAVILDLALDLLVISRRTFPPSAPDLWVGNVPVSNWDFLQAGKLLSVDH